MADTSFTVKGKAGVYGNVTIGWAAGVFDDPTGRVQLLIDAGEQICATPTGPCFTAAPAPGHVALLTAVRALDEVTELEGGEKYAQELVELTAVPDGATA